MGSSLFLNSVQQYKTRHTYLFVLLSTQQLECQHTPPFYKIFLITYGKDKLLEPHVLSGSSNLASFENMVSVKHR